MEKKKKKKRNFLKSSIIIEQLFDNYKNLETNPQNDVKSYGIGKICVFAIVLEHCYQGGGVPIGPVVKMVD